LLQVAKRRINKKLVAFVSVAALVLGGLSAQASGILNTPTGGYLVCVDTKTGAVTHPGTLKCKKGQKRLVLGAQGPAGLVGATGLPGKNGNTLWTGNGEPSSTLGIPGDSYLDLVGKKMYSPKATDGLWPAGISVVGPQGPQGPGGSGPAGPAGPAGANGTAITELLLCDGPDAGSVANEKCKIGMTGPGGGVIFFVDYNDVYADFNYLEASNFEPCLDGENYEVPWTSDSDSQGVLHDPTSRERSRWVGSGPSNTAAMLETITAADPATEDYIGDLSGAAAFANNFVCGGKTDWFLGSLGEMKLLLEAALEVEIENATEQSYWTSSSAGFVGPVQGLAFVVDLGRLTRENRGSFAGLGAGMPTVHEWSKNEDLAVRPIRRF